VVQSGPVGVLQLTGDVVGALPNPTSFTRHRCQPEFGGLAVYLQAAAQSETQTQGEPPAASAAAHHAIVSIFAPPALHASLPLLRRRAAAPRPRRSAYVSPSQCQLTLAISRVSAAEAARCSCPLRLCTSTIMQLPLRW
jgi:hypothetical protein